MERTIPKPAPEDKPVKYGSANGFFDIVCKNIPAKAKQEPDTIAFITAGILIYDNINPLFDKSSL